MSWYRTAAQRQPRRVLRFVAATRRPHARVRRRRGAPAALPLLVRRQSRVHAVNIVSHPDTKKNPHTNKVLKLLQMAKELPAPLRWLHENVMQTRGVALSACQLDELATMVRGDGTLAHTVMTVAALTAHAEVFDWCLDHTDARPWVVATTPLCNYCCAMGMPAFMTQCGRGPSPNSWIPSHVVWKTAPMLAACCSGDLGFVRRLITEHRECAVRVRDASLRDGNGATALLWACCRNDASVVDWLITTAGCRPEHERGMVHATALMQACMFGHLDVVRWLVSTFAGLLDHVNAYDDTALILACTNGHVHVARWLVSQAGCCVKRERNKYGTSALLAACCVGHLDVVRYLVTEAGSCAKTERNRNGDTALLHACEQGHVDVARWLVAEAGSSIHDKNSVRWCACAGNCCVARGEFTSPREPQAGEGPWACAASHDALRVWLIDEHDVLPVRFVHGASRCICNFF